MARSIRRSASVGGSAGARPAWPRRPTGGRPAGGWGVCAEAQAVQHAGKRQEEQPGEDRDEAVSPFMIHGLDVWQFLKEGTGKPDHNR